MTPPQAVIPMWRSVHSSAGTAEGSGAFRKEFPTG